MGDESKPTVNPTGACMPNTVIPDDWAALGATTGYDPKKAEDLRLFIVGPSGEGKTTFVNSIPDNLILDFDDGANASPGSVATRIPVPHYERMMLVIDKLVADAKAGKRRFQRVTFDTIDEMVSLTQKQLEREKQVEDITEFGSQGHGYNLILGRIWSKVRELEEAGYTWAFVGHLRTKTEVNPVTKKEETKLREATFPSVAKKILTRSDFKLTAYSLLDTKKIMAKRNIPGRGEIEVEVGKEDTTVYYIDTMTTAARDGKARGVPTLARKIQVPLCGGWSEFATQYDAAVEEARKQTQS